MSDLDVTTFWTMQCKRYRDIFVACTFRRHDFGINPYLKSDTIHRLRTCEVEFYLFGGIAFSQLDDPFSEARSRQCSSSVNSFSRIFSFFLADLLIFGFDFSYYLILIFFGINNAFFSVKCTHSVGS